MSLWLQEWKTGTKEAKIRHIQELLLRWDKCDTPKKESAVAICNQYHNIQHGCNNHSK